MEFLIAIGLIVAGAAYVTSIPCRMLEARGRRASFAVGFLAALVTAALAILFVFQADLFYPSRWNTSKVHTGVMIAMAFGLAVAIGLVPAMLVVTHFRRRFRNEKPAN